MPTKSLFLLQPSAALPRGVSRAPALVRAGACPLCASTCSLSCAPCLLLPRLLLAPLNSFNPWGLQFEMCTRVSSSNRMERKHSLTPICAWGQRGAAADGSAQQLGQEGEGRAAVIGGARIQKRVAVLMAARGAGQQQVGGLPAGAAGTAALAASERGPPGRRYGCQLAGSTAVSGTAPAAGTQHKRAATALACSSERCPWDC